MSRHKQFDECVTLEGWWQDTYHDWMANNLDITIICAHPSSVLKQQAIVQEQSRISHVHSLTLDLNDFIRKTKAVEPEPIRVLVAEPEEDHRTMYQEYLRSMPVEIASVASGAECLARTLGPDNENYDMIIIDTHLKDMNGLELAKKIAENKKNINVILTSTWDSDTVRSTLEAHSLDIEKYPMLHKPFRFSQLLGLIKPARQPANFHGK